MRRENERLREALAPFAEACTISNCDDDEIIDGRIAALPARSIGSAGRMDNDIIRFLRGDTSMLKCTVCGAQAGTCDCWTKCSCGWSFRKGTACRNPVHRAARQALGGEG